jgi:hypothetical protein
MKYRIIFAAALGAALAACASTPAYTPAAAQGAAGYSERQIEDNRFFVTYRAPSATNAEQLNDFALLRAADLTLERGHEWFWVDRRSLEGQNERRSGFSFGVGVGAGSYGRNGGASVGVGTSVPLGGTVRGTANAATLEIRLGSGPKPDDPNAYDARAVSSNVRSRLP